MPAQDYVYATVQHRVHSISQVPAGIGYSKDINQAMMA